MNEYQVNYQQLIENENWNEIRKNLSALDPIEISRLIEKIPEGDEIVLFALFDRKQAKEVFRLISHHKQRLIIEGLAENIQKQSNLLNDLEPDARTAFFKELPGKAIQGLIQILSPKERSISIELLGYPKDSIGRLMTPEYVAIRPEQTVEEAFQAIRRYGMDSETLNVIYIVNSDWELLDDVRIKELILAAPDQKIEELMDHKFVSLNALDDQEMAIKVFRDYDRVALPVLSKEGILVGIVTVDDIMDVVEIESTEDFHKFGAFQNAVANPLLVRVFKMYKNRVVWLVALVFMNVFSGAALSSFEETIQSMVSLVFFLPLLIDSGGNAGSQSATLMIRSLAMGDVKLTDWYRLIGKEILVSLLLGCTMAVGVSLIAWVRAPEIVMIVAVTMIITVVMGSLTGMLLPFIFTKLKVDPATASAPLITSISDIGGVLVYFSIASMYLAT